MEKSKADSGIGKASGRDEQDAPLKEAERIIKPRMSDWLMDERKCVVMGNGGHMIAYRFFIRENGNIKSKMGQQTWLIPDGSPGKWIEHAGPIKLCCSGLHASPTPFLALKEARGYILAQVEAEGIEASDDNKFACRRMRILRLQENQHLVGLATLAGVMSLKYFEHAFPKDSRPRHAINASLRLIENPVRVADTAEEALAAADAAGAAGAAETAGAELAAAAGAAWAVEESTRVAGAAAAGVAGAAAAVGAGVAAAVGAGAAAAGAARDEWTNEFNKAAERVLSVPTNEIMRTICEVTGFERK